MEKTAELLKRYEVLLDLYAELESVTGEICRALETGFPLIGIAERLREKKILVEKIGDESRAIAALKKTIADRNLISDDERTLVRHAEENLTDIVNRVVDQGARSCDLMMKQGVRVTRR